MKAICKYTGLELISSSGFARWNVLSEHPVFSVPLVETLTMAATEWSPEMFVLDKKLLMLSIAKSCELITWENTREFTPALPNPSTVESTIEPLLLIAGWIDYQRSVDKHVSYPSFRISSETQGMQEFRHMLNEIISNRDVTSRQEVRAHRLVCLEANARNLSSKCSIGADKEKALLGVTAEWAMSVTEEALNSERVDLAIRDDWKLMLMTPASQLKAKGFSINDVHELRDFLTDHLPHGSVIAHDVIAHLHRLVEVNSFTDIDGGAILSARILSNGMLTASATEPKRAEYASIVEYARARAKWLLVEAQKAETAKELEKLQKIELANKLRNTGGSDDI